MSANAPVRYLLDTNVLVAYIRGGNVGQWIEGAYHLQSTPAVPLICVVTEGEIRSLSLQRNWGASKVRQLQRLVDYFVSVPLEFAGIIDAYAEIDNFNRQNGQAMGKNDVWIAATARVTRARLLTTDRDFDHLNGVFLERDWIDQHSAL